jgi:hypothetical protein
MDGYNKAPLMEDLRMARDRNEKDAVEVNCDLECEARRKGPSLVVEMSETDDEESQDGEI